MELPETFVEDSTFLVRTEKPSANTIYHYLHSYTPMFVLMKPLVGDDYVVDIEGEKVNLELSDAIKLVFDPSEGGDVVYEETKINGI